MSVSGSQARGGMMLPVKANSGRTSRSRSLGSARLRTASALFKLLLTSPTCGANCRQPILILSLQPNGDRSSNSQQHLGLDLPSVRGRRGVRTALSSSSRWRQPSRQRRYIVTRKRKTARMYKQILSDLGKTDSRVGKGMERKQNAR